jgi:streptomycin 6-kinase
MDPFDPWLDQWALTIDGSPIRTASSDLLPVLRDGAPAMLKVAHSREEQRGASILTWFAGEGAVRVLEIDGPALLLERACGHQSLADMSKSGRDDDATRILCGAVRILHAARDRRPPSDLIPLAVWFRALESNDHPLLARSKVVARTLLADMPSVIPLHGDIHHDNVLHDRGRGWLAIDPKGLLGDRTFDYTNIFCNPDLESATAPVNFSRRLDLVAQASGVNRQRILEWVCAYAGLSASWCMEDEDRDGVELRLAIVEMTSGYADRLRAR